MPTDGKNAMPKSRELEMLFKQVLDDIHQRSKSVLKRELVISGTPYLGTACIQMAHAHSLFRRKKKGSVLVQIRPGLLRGEKDPWIIQCDVFNRDIEEIAETALRAVAEQVGSIGFSITKHYR